MGDFGFDWGDALGGGGGNANDWWNSWVGNNSDTYSGALSNAFGGSDNSGSGSGVLGWLGSLFGGGSGNGSSGSGGNIWGSLLSGALSGYGQGGMTEAQMKLKSENDIKAIQETGRQGRYNTSYAAQLKDYYDQLDKNRKRTALDTYGQFSLMDRYAPNRTTVAAPQVPNYPTNT